MTTDSLDRTATASTPNSAAMLPLELTLIVAATRNMGIGRAGTLPWTGLKQEMAYFARVTKRTSSLAGQASNDTVFPVTKNAVIMGRKTWDSIPAKFRPLKGRLNVVLSHSHQDDAGAMGGSDGPVNLKSINSALETLGGMNGIGKMFVIGGAEIYKTALGMKEAKRILLTKVLSDFECDTIFPLKLGEDADGEWQKRTKEELDKWVGEKVPEGVQDENGVQYVFEMYEKATGP